MGSMKDLYTQGVTDLESYNIGYQAGIQRVIKIMNDYAADSGPVFHSVWYLVSIIEDQIND
jgi:hypothetical protein